MNNINLQFKIPQGNNKQWINELNNIIEQHYNNPNFGVVAMAKEIGLSERSLFYKMKEDINETPSNYLKNYRLKKAYNLLLNKQTNNISDVCYQTGFNNVHHFSRQFRAVFNCSPTQILKE